MIKKMKKNYIKCIAMCLAVFQIFTAVPIDAYASTTDETSITSEEVNIVEEEQIVSDDLDIVSEVVEVEDTQESFIDESETKEYQELTESASETEDISLGEELIIETIPVEQTKTESETESSGFIKTFKVTTVGGTLKIYDVNKYLIAELGYNQEKSFSGSEIPEQVYIEAVAENGYYVESYLTKIPLSDGSTYTTATSVYGIQTGSYTKWCYVTEQGNETFEISFNNTLTSSFSIGAFRGLTRTLGDLNDPEVGDTYSGQAYMVYSGSPSSNFNQIGGYVVATSGAFSGMNITMTTCLSGTDYASPQTGQTGTYTVTIVSVDAATNTATIYATWANDFITSGYQNTGGYSTYTFTPPKGKIEIEKKSSSSELTNGNSCYSLEGAVYGIYNDAGTLYGTITTDVNGYGIVNDIPAGNFYVQEISPPQGYALDTEQHWITITASQTTSLNVSDVPLNDPIIVALQKQDSLTRVGLANAEFTIKYYDVQSDTDPALAGRTPLKTWVVKTNASGIAGLSDIYKVSGDSWYILDGDIVVPLGTITIQETKAPGGYQIDSEVFVRVIKEGEIPGAVITYNAPTIPNTPYELYININKVDGRTSSSLTGVTFKVQEWDGSSYVDNNSYKVTYDTSTKLYKSDKLYYTQKNEGKYRLVETGVPTGYTSSWSQEFVITGSNTGTTLTVTATNTPYQAKVSVSKTDSLNAKLLSGATFKLQEWNGSSYSDSSYAIAWNTSTRTYESATLYYTQTNAGKYKVVEVANPYGYVSTWSQEFTITQNNQSFSYTATNKQVWAKVKLNKIDSESTLSDPQGDATLEGAVYEIYFNETVTHPDGTVYTKGDLAGIETTDSNGELTFTDLVPYKYYIVEKTPSNGYLLDETIYYIDCTHDGKATSISKSVTVTEQIKKQAFELIKISSNGDSGETELLEKAGFKVYLISDLTGVVNGTLTPSNGSYYTAADFATYDFTNENTAIDYSSGTAVNIAEMFTDSKGYLVSPELGYGRYVVIESTTPQNHETIKPFLVTVTDDDRTPQVWRVFNDAPFEFYLKIIKKDSESKNIILKTGASYLIKNADTGAYVEQSVTYPKPIIFGTIENPYTVTEEGYLVTPKKMQSGNYEIYEVSAPDGYVLDIDPIVISIDSSTAMQVDESTGEMVVVVEQYNQQQYGQLNILKQGEKVSGFTIDAAGNYTFEYSLVGLENVDFDIVADEDIYSQDNQCTLLYAKGKVVESLRTDTAGKVSSIIPLPIGKYRIIEIETQDGFLLMDDQTFEITYQGQEIELVMVDKEFVNQRQVHEIEILKTDVNNDEVLAGAKFALSLTEDLKVGEKVIEAGTVIQAKVTNSSGKAIFTDIPEGSYQVVEVKAPEKYLLNEEFKATFILEGDRSQKEILTYTANCKNDYTKVEISKKDLTNEEELPGATLQIKDKEGNIIEEWVSGEEAHYIEKLPVGDYNLIEIIAPDGYVTSKDVEFTIEDKAEIQTVVMHDDITKVSISKQDITTKEELPGAHLQIVDKEGKVVEEWISGNEPHYIEKLPVEKYALIETSAPDGYEIAENVEFEVKDNGDILHVVMYDSPIQTVPKTGDSNFNSMLLYAGIAILALGTIAILGYKKSKKNKK